MQIQRKKEYKKLEQYKRNLKPQNQLLDVDISTILFSIFIPNNIFLPNKRGLAVKNPIEMPLF